MDVDIGPGMHPHSRTINKEATYFVGNHECTVFESGAQTSELCDKLCRPNAVMRTFFMFNWPWHIEGSD
jgi:hypothetical protein